MAKANKLTPKKKNNFFVAVSSPNSMKVDLLETRKIVLQSLKIFSELKEIRKKKIEMKSMLRKQVVQISSTLNKIKSAMPAVNLLPEETKTKIPKEKQSKQEIAAESKEKKPATEIDKIEAELAEIEGKLSAFR